MTGKKPGQRSPRYRFRGSQAHALPPPSASRHEECGRTALPALELRWGVPAVTAAERRNTFKMMALFCPRHTYINI